MDSRAKYEVLHDEVSCFLEEQLVMGQCGGHEIDVDRWFVAGCDCGKWEPKTQADCCKGLLAAVMDRAIRDLICPCEEFNLDSATNRQLTPMVKLAAQRWFDSDEMEEHEGFMTFAKLCLLLDLNHVKVRKAVYRMARKEKGMTGADP